jgi:hypothetical protein
LVQHLIGLFNVVLVTFLLWQYQSQWRDRLSALIPLALRFMHKVRTLRG